MARLAFALSLILLMQYGVAAEDRLGVRPGMSSAELVAALMGRCTDRWMPPPYLTCIYGKTVIGASVSPKDRTEYVSWREPSDLPQKAYAEMIAAELGFEGPGASCPQDYSYPAWCWYGDDGTILYAGKDYGAFTGEAKDKGLYFNALDNDRIRTEDEED